MANADPYKILGVSKDASQDDIKRAYRRLAKEHHPDRNPTNKEEATRRFKEIQAAYEVLGDAERRSEFDRFGAGGPRPHYERWSTHGGPFEESANFDFGDLGSIFEQFFSRGGTRGARRAGTARRRPAGANLSHEVSISLREAAEGATREVALSVDGQTDRIHFRIPKGVTDGQKIRLRGQGQPGPGGRGDLIVTCRVLPDPRFRREGANLLVDLPLTFAQAALGARVDVPTLSGIATLTVPPGASGGARLRLRGHGLPDPKTGDNGDLFAVVRIKVPKSLPPEARELIQRLDEMISDESRQQSSAEV
ncbi:MAG: J domain-containing protein [Phycisphaerales bacterium]|nr:J domain-containing protein [Phycisphaerales bacterium]